MTDISKGQRDSILKELKTSDHSFANALTLLLNDMKGVRADVAGLKSLGAKVDELEVNLEKLITAIKGDEDLSIRGIAHRVDDNEDDIEGLKSSHESLKAKFWVAATVATVLATIGSSLFELFLSVKGP